MLNQEDKTRLIEIARKTLEAYIMHGMLYKVKNSSYSNSLKTHCGVFVSLYNKHQLRGCIGRFQPKNPLYEVVRDMAISASTRDYRFNAVEADELMDIDIELSILTPLEIIKDTSKIKLGQHGIYIKKGAKSGTFLPQVATQTGWTLDEFLGHCARDKAQIGWNGWKKAELYIYEAIIFSEKDLSP